MKLLPKTLREKLVEQFGETVVEIKAIHHEKSMQTDKVLFELSDGNRVETVGLFYKEGWNSFRSAHSANKSQGVFGIHHAKGCQ